MTIQQFRDRTFDREVRYDEKSKQYPLRATFQKLASDEPRSYTWSCPVTLDQGPDGACVGYSITQEIAARPKMHLVDPPLAERIYREAKTIDEWAGEDYEGTSVLAGMKVAQRLGYFTAYRWAFSLNDALVGVSRKGPGILGCWWYEGMFEPDAHGLIHPTGEAVGGHAILVNGVSVTRRTVRLHNSWGPSWGTNGECEMPWDEFEFLLHDDGEFCIPQRA